MARFSSIVPLLLAAVALAPHASGDPVDEHRKAVAKKANEVVTAAKANDASALAALAKSNGVDVWYVVDEIQSLGEDAAATAFAAVMPQAYGDRVRAFVAARRGKPYDHASRDALRAVQAEPTPAGALERLGTLAGTGDDVTSVRIAFVRGILLRHAGRMKESVEASLRAAEVARRVGYLEATGQSLDGGWQLAFSIGAWQLCLDCLEASIALAEAMGERERLGNALLNSGSVRIKLSDYRGAVKAYERAVAVGREKRERESSLLARALANLGRAYDTLGHRAKALSLLEQALEAPGAKADRREHALILVSQGLILSEVGDQEAARSKLRAALELAAPGDLALRMHVSVHRSAVERAAGNLEEASRAFSESGLTTEMLAASSLERAALHAARGDRDAAQGALRVGLSHARSTGDSHHVVRSVIEAAWVMLSLGMEREAYDGFERGRGGAAEGGWADARIGATIGMVRIHRDRKEHAKAADLARTAVDELLASGLLGGLSEDVGASARDRFAELFALGVECAAALDDPALVCQFLESGRAGTLLEGLRARTLLEGHVVPEELSRSERFARADERRAQEELDRATASGARAAVLEAKQKLASARAAREETAQRLRREAKAAAGVLLPQPATLAQITKTLAADEAFVSLGLAGDHAVALVVTAAGARVVSLGPTKAIDEACSALALDDPASTPDAAVAALRDRVTKPWALPAAVKRVLLSPDGALCYVPFTLLDVARRFVYVPSGTVHALLAADPARGSGVLALGDPDYSRVAAEPSRMFRKAERGGLTPLPATRKEVEAIGDVKLLGSDASEARLAVELAKRPRWRAVHLACHGLVNAERPMLSSLALTPDTNDDGFLTGLEVLQMGIPADLAVLSACETARGRTYRAEGIMGLTRAFMTAGSTRVLCSLWKVDDAATQALMTHFYGLWNPKKSDRGSSASESLRKAQEHVRGKPAWKHPYYWAAWVLWGAGE